MTPTAREFNRQSRVALKRELGDHRRWQWQALGDWEEDGHRVQWSRKYGRLYSLPIGGPKCDYIYSLAKLGIDLEVTPVDDLLAQIFGASEP